MKSYENKIEDLQLNKMSKCRIIQDVDVNTINDTQINYCNSCTNLPRGNENGYLITIKYIDTYMIQKYFRRADRSEYTRYKENGVWTEWVNAGIEELNVSSLLTNDWVIHSDTGCQIFRQGKIVHIQLCIKDGTNKVVMTVPNGYRPNKSTYFPCVSNRVDTYGYISISSTGTLSINNDLVGKLIFINISYKVD